MCHAFYSLAICYLNVVTLFFQKHYFDFQIILRLCYMAKYYCFKRVTVLSLQTMQMSLRSQCYVIVIVISCDLISLSLRFSIFKR